jgi:lauroyl/myristoyl acyltransferase
MAVQFATATPAIRRAGRVRWRLITPLNQMLDKRSEGRASQTSTNSRNKVARLLARAGTSAWLYRLGVRLLPHVPLSIGYTLCTPLSLLAPLTPVWPHIQANLRQVLPDASAADRGRLGRAVVAGLLKNYFELLRMPAMSPDELLCMVEVRGLNNLHEALGRGKGAIVAMPHIGNLSLVAEPIERLARGSIVVVIEQMRDPAVHDLMRSFRQRGTIDMVEVGPSSARLLTRALAEGRIVVLACDRAVASATTVVTFFGEPVTMPVGPAMLALRTGAPLMTAFTYRLPDNRSEVVIDPPIVIDQRRDLRSDVRRLMQAVFRIFESYIRRDPAQWLLTEPVWSVT